MDGRLLRGSQRVSKRWASALAGVFTTLGLSGCMAGKINDNLVEMNATMALVQEDLTALRKTTDRLAKMDEEVKPAVERLASVADALAETNASLASVVEDLAALRETTGRIAGMDADDAPVKDP